MVLIKSVLQAIPVHVILSGWTAKFRIKKLEKVSRSFLWKHGNSAGLHLLNWNSVKMPLKLGGLGLKDLHAFRISLLALSLCPETAKQG